MSEDEQEDDAAEEAVSRSSSSDSQQQQQRCATDRFKLVYEPSPVVPPDGGYGWAVVAAAFVVNMIADGVTFSFGILLSELFKSLDDSREDISWIGSFLAGVPLLLGPVTSVLIDRFGCREVTMAGGLIAGLGFCLMFVLPRSTALFVFSAGLLTGIGLGLAFMPAVVAVSFYFVEKRALATGLSVSGSGVGTVVFAYITRACIEDYTWRGSFLIIGAILFNICVCGALYRPLEPLDLKEKKRMQKLYIQFQANSCAGQGGLALSPSPTSAAAVSSASSSPSPSALASPTASHNRQAGSSTLAATVVAVKSLLSIPTYLAEEFQQPQAQPLVVESEPRFTARSSPTDERQLIANLKLGYLKRLAAMPADASATVHSNGFAGISADVSVGSVAMAKANTSHELVDYAQTISRQHKQQQKRRLEHKQMQQQQQLEQEQSQCMSIVVCLPQLPGQQLQLQQQQQQQQQQPQQQQRPRVNTSSHTARRQLFPVDRRYFMQHTRAAATATTVIELWDSCPEFGRIPAASALHNRGGGVGGPSSVPTSPRSRSRPHAKLASRLAQSKAFRDVRFLFTSWDYVSFLASNFLLYFWYDITYTFLPDHANEIGLSNSDVSLIIALIGVSNTIGQIVIGYIGDFPRVDTVLLYALCMSLTGVANFLVPWCSSLASLLVYGIIYGFLVSANYSLCSVVIIDLFSLERLTTGYGFMMFFQGIANLLGPPAMGHMRDADASYNRSFLFSGVFVLASNLLILPMYRTLYKAAKGCCGGPREDGVGVVADDAAVLEPLTSAA